VARGTAFDIARHSLREAPWAAAGAIGAPSKARTAKTDRSMADISSRLRPHCIVQSRAGLGVDFPFSVMPFER
jgi:hypothetical protein